MTTVYIHTNLRVSSKCILEDLDRIENYQRVFNLGVMYNNPIMIGTFMAKKDQNKFYPVERKLLFGDPPGTGLRILEVHKGLSGQNRRLYRQNRVYSVKVDATGTDNQSFDVYRLRNTFMLQRGYELAMKEWNKSFEEGKDVVRESSVGRWRDFRIELTPTVGDTPSPPGTLRSSGQYPRLIPTIIDEWLTSLSYDETGAGRSFGLYSDVNTFGILEEYEKMGHVSEQPSSPMLQAAYAELNENLTDQEVANLQTHGDEPPYDLNSTTPVSVLEYVGTVFVDKTSGLEKRSTGFFDAPLGAVFISGLSGKIESVRDPLDVNVKPGVFNVTVQKGDYKGVKAHEYVDAKKLGA